jgi:diacylglycerol kinase (ATP)
LDRHFVIVNPVSGRGSGARAIAPVEGHLTDLGIEFDLATTEYPWHAAELAECASGKGYGVVVAVGGDGTANEVLNGLMAAKLSGKGEAALAVLCVGRGNDFAFGTGIAHDLVEGCRALKAGVRRRIDVGRVTGGDFPDGRYFGNGVGIGFDAVVGFEAQKLKRLRGFAGYFVAALRTIFLYFHAPLVRIERDSEPIELRALMVSVMNGRRMGGGFMMAPHASPDDGQFDYCIAREVSRGRIFSLIPRFMKGSQEGHAAISMGRAVRVSVTALEGTLPAHADGETLCRKGTRLELELLPAQIEVICPAPVSRR